MFKSTNEDGKVLKTYYNYKILNDGFRVAHGWTKLNISNVYCYSKLEFTEDDRLIVYVRGSEGFRKFFLRLGRDLFLRLAQLKFHFQMDEEEYLENKSYM